MLKVEVGKFSYTPFTKESLQEFEPPSNAIMIDTSKERSIPINKYIFSEEKILSKDPKKEELIKKIEAELPKLGDKITLLNTILCSKRTKKFPTFWLKLPP